MISNIASYLFSHNRSKFSLIPESLFLTKNILQENEEKVKKASKKQKTEDISGSAGFISTPSILDLGDMVGCILMIP